MKQSIAVLIASAVIIGFISFPAVAQTKPTSSGVTMTNAYDAFGSEKKGLKHESNTKENEFCSTPEQMREFLKAISNR